MMKRGMIAGHIGFGYQLGIVTTTRLLREPLVHFLLIGAAIFLLNGWINRDNAPSTANPAAPAKRILVTGADLAPLVSEFTRAEGRDPTPGERQKLVDRFVHDEVLYREALALGLDKEDPVIRRRLQQKMEFILDDVAMEEPTDAQVRDYMARHMDTYGTEPQVAFQYVFVNAADRGAEADAHALSLLEQLRQGADPVGMGDQSPLQTEYPLTDISDIKRDYGDAMAEALLRANTNAWTGPVTSKLGVHLVRVTKRFEPQLRSLDQMGGMAKRGWQMERREQLKQAAYEKIRQRYEVEVEPKPAEEAQP